MLRRLVLAGSLAVLAAAAPAAAHEPSASPASVRALEEELLGSAHATEHADQRALARRYARQARRDAERPRQAPLEADNSLVAPTRGGFWSEPVRLPVVAINATLMRTGRVLVFAYPWRPHRTDPETGEKLSDANRAVAYVFDPATGRSRRIDPPVDPDTGKPANIFCAGTSTLPDGRVLVVGGNVGDPTETQNKGLNTVFTFDPATEAWETHERTRQGRWYPSQLEMADGRTVILGGIPKPGDFDWSPNREYRLNTDIEIFDPLTGDVQRLESLSADEAPGNPPLLGQYPHLWWMPGGHALVAGPRRSDTWRLHPPARGADDATWTDLPDMPIHREWAPGVLLPGSTRVMLFGGADRDDHATAGYYPANGSTTVFDDAAPERGWYDGPDMRVERAFHNAVQLPDGDVAIVGGGFGEDPSRENYRWEFRDAQRRVELFDPGTGRFTLGNAQAEGRAYHSSALLLPDGRVLSAGDDINGPGGPGTGVRRDTAELWSPPYLFEDRCEPRARPILASAPAAVAYGAEFFAGARGRIAAATLVAPGADTHNTDMSQRVVPLAAPVAQAGGVRLRAPETPDLAPPGYYMLFLLDERGTPSVARFVHLGGTDEGLAGTVPAAPLPDACAPVEVDLDSGTPGRAAVGVRVTVTRGARVVLSGHGIRRARATFARPGTKTVRLRLGPGARRRLAKGRAVTVRAVARARAGAPARASARIRATR
jgi:hypothetical protein